jgi:3-isopropylmalate/(R)-2-methylmalate dehydratase large subunit
MAKTLFDKIWDRHIVKHTQGVDVLYIDQHYIHEVTSPQAFDGLRSRNIKVHKKKRTLATADHNVPTINQTSPIREPLSRKQVEKLTFNCEEFGVNLFGLGHPNQGIVHVIGPELGYTRPGMTIVCGDSHTSTHGAFGCVAFGIGTSQVEQVLATQSLVLKKPKNMRITLTGKLKKGVLSKDVILYIISRIGTAGCTGHFVEYAGDTIEGMSMEARMTICNMSIEMGARGGLIRPDRTTYEYLQESYKVDEATMQESMAFWTALFTDEDAKFDKELHFDASEIDPMVTYGTNPGMGIKITDPIPDHNNSKAIKYMGLHPGDKLLGKEIQYVFIGSCTNARIEDLRIVADYVKGKRKSDSVHAMIIPGSKHVELQAKDEGLDRIFKAAGFELREPGCSACLGMNEDKIPREAYCVSTSNRNFEGRQGPGARTILASPITAAAAAVHGKIVDVRNHLD